VSPATGYLSQRLPRATPVLEPLPIQQLTVRLDADGRVALGLVHTVTMARAAWTGFSRGPCPRRTPRAGISLALFISF
jgi:hypothetical protein